MNGKTSLHQILLQPTDVLFFRDGRPMAGSLAGHTAAWPLPDVTNHALHAALHRAGFTNAHAHRIGRSGAYSDQRVRKFGCLVTAGPFPVQICEKPDAKARAVTWYFP
ncbi:MAG: type III-B CRISPR module-associated protein Cmr3, partial [Verrucomicrobiae bacterium]|nr:type III-B CRISPR module-associated protein Cmr3 [Verrucomicrobiae bacterium]